MKYEFSPFRSLCWMNLESRFSHEPNSLGVGGSLNRPEAISISSISADEYLRLGSTSPITKESVRYGFDPRAMRRPRLVGLYDLLEMK